MNAPETPKTPNMNKQPIIGTLLALGTAATLVVGNPSLPKAQATMDANSSLCNQFPTPPADQFLRDKLQAQFQEIYDRHQIRPSKRGASAIASLALDDFAKKPGSIPLRVNEPLRACVTLAPDRWDTGDLSYV